MRYRIRFILPHGSTGHWAREYATREEAQRAIDDRQKETGLAYSVEEVVPTAAVPDATPDPTASNWPGQPASTPHPATPEARIRELEAEIAQLRDAYDAARQDMDVARRKVAEVKTTAAMLESDLFTARESAKVAWARSQEASCKTVGFMIRLDRAIELGDAMHRAHPSEEWASYKDSLAASRQGPAKASEAPGEGGDSGEGAK